MLYEISDQVKNNILVFLDKVSYVGFREVVAINEVLNALNNPIKESIVKEKGVDDKEKI